MLEIDRIEVDLKKALEYFSEHKVDEFTGEIIEQISESLIVLEMVRDTGNKLTENDRSGLIEKITKVSSNCSETIKEEELASTTPT
jgi:hypothetical protein